MASGFPGSIDNFTDPLANSSLASPSHAGQHADLNDAVEKIETYMGLVKVIPTSVTSAGGTAATLSANGTVNVNSGNTSVNVNGAFTSQYERYRVFINIYGSAASSAAFKFRASGTDSSTAYYQSGIYTTFSSSTVTGFGGTNGTNFSCAQFGNTSAYLHGGSIEIAFPQTSTYTTCQVAILDPYAGQQYNFAVWHLVASPYDGFTISAASGSIAGTIRVYGYRN